MRIVLDLARCTEGGTSDAILLCQELARHAGTHTLIVAVPATLGSATGRLRSALACQVLVYELPATEGAQAWVAAAAGVVHQGFLASLNADLVCTPGPGTDGPELAMRGAAALTVPLAGNARALWTLFEQQAPAPVPAAAPRPRLAYISPLPPEPSGIADYSAELLPQLARFYDVEAIVDQAEVSEGWARTNVPLRTVEQFRQNADSYDRVLYHFGNSLMHRHMFELIEQHPGVVVLHDFYLANVLHAMHYSGYRFAAMQRALLASHGIAAVQDMDRMGESKAVWKYPCNKIVLDHAEGVIVHSDYPRQLAQRWYGAQAADAWQVLPLLRGHARPVDRAAARAELGLGEQDVLVCSFGLLGRTKLNHKLLEAWLDTPLARDSGCQLVFVGEAGDSEYGIDMKEKVAACKRKYRPRITGYVSPGLYQTYLAACDIAVQLRAESRGETSAAVLDCLLHGVATIANAHGSSAELPASVMVKLDDEFTTADLGAALQQLRADAGARAALGNAALAFIAAEHAPAHVGQLYFDAIEDFARRSPQRAYRAMIGQLAGLDAPMPPDSKLIGVANAIARNQAPAAPRQLLVDISALVQTDLKTGIQRVVRSILQVLLETPPAGYRIEPVYSRGRGAPYQYARSFMLAPIECQLHDLEDTPADMRRGDMFLGIDLLIHMVAENRAQLQAFRDRGGEVYFVVYDLLPVLRPDVFPEGTDEYFAGWLATIGAVSDGLVCISRAVADELATWMETHPPERADPLHLAYFHLGADIDASAPSFGMPPDAAQVLQQVRARPSLIMVGTVEPRKGQLQSLNAFELLWQAGQDVNLVIVGKQGWMMDGLATRLKEHPELGRRLFWMAGVSDEMLLALYQASAALLAPSEGEGFGLPLIEAAQHGLPIIARDLPVFREVAGEHAFYFSGLRPEDLAAGLEDWLAQYRAGTAPTVKGLRWLNWTESAGQLTAALIDQQWYRDIAATAQP